MTRNLTWSVSFASKDLLLYPMLPLIGSSPEKLNSVAKHVSLPFAANYKQFVSYFRVISKYKLTGRVAPLMLDLPLLAPPLCTGNPICVIAHSPFTHPKSYDKKGDTPWHWHYARVARKHNRELTDSIPNWTYYPQLGILNLQLGIIYIQLGIRDIWVY